MARAGWAHGTIWANVIYGTRHALSRWCCGPRAVLGGTAIYTLVALLLIVVNTGHNILVVASKGLPAYPHLLCQMVSFQSEHVEYNEARPLTRLDAGILLSPVCLRFGVI